ncbi:protein phosphatase 2C domain-containing protein [Marinitoga aeolica]|uniref:Protein phosphatase 2C domain-containing protein n=1 Tax=Marinitoga aeolica TaxID=2809031 RepID=A0ABY8PRB0_9BACT|nr:protein phosphatase 2C domain-containing protein [Marinitoga aeolica]WGS65189.1 protein phosphatase 2C domain-containing protein [Marinitoga aeolica]
MAYIESRIEKRDILIFNNVEWITDFKIFKEKPNLENIEYPLKNFENNEVLFLFDEKLKPFKEVNNDIESVINMTLNLLELMEKTEENGYKFFIIDPKSIYFDQELKPYIFLYYPIFSEYDIVELKKFNMPISIRSKISKFDLNNSTLIAEIFARLLFGDDYISIGKIKEKKYYVKEKLKEMGEYDLQYWFKKSLYNDYSIKQSKKIFLKTLERRKRRKTQKKLIEKIARATKSSEGSKKLKEEDDFLDDVNQDSWFKDVYNEKAIFAVMDGVSTAKVGNGKIASNIVKEIILNKWDELKEKDINTETVKRFIEDILKESNEKILIKAKELKKEFNATDIMASTLALVILYNDNLYIASVGDSNIFIMNKDYILKMNIEHNIKREKLINKRNLKGKESSLTEYIGKYKQIENEIVPEKINYFYSETKLLDDEIVLVSSDGVLDYWKGEEDNKEDFFKEDFFKIYSKYNKLKVAAIKIICELESNEAADNITLHLFNPIYKKEEK